MTHCAERASSHGVVCKPRPPRPPVMTTSEPETPFGLICFAFTVAPLRSRTSNCLVPREASSQLPRSVGVASIAPMKARRLCCGEGSTSMLSTFALGISTRVTRARPQTPPFEAPARPAVPPMPAGAGPCAPRVSRMKRVRIDATSFSAWSKARFMPSVEGRLPSETSRARIHAF